MTPEDIVLTTLRRATEHARAENEPVRGTRTPNETLYLLNRKHFFAGFHWNADVPASERVRVILECHTRAGYIKIKDAQDRDGDPTTYFEYQSNPDLYVEHLRLSDELSSDIDELIRFAASKSAREMKLLMLANYIAVHSGDPDDRSAGNIFYHLGRLRPDAKFARSEIKRALSELLDHGYL